MATIMKRGVKRRLAEVSQREDKLKLRRQVYEEIEKNLKSQNKNRGIFAIVARQLALTDDQVRNHYKAEQKLVKRRGGSSQEYVDLSGGEPTTIVIFLLFLSPFLFNVCLFRKLIPQEDLQSWSWSKRRRSCGFVAKTSKVSVSVDQ